MGAGEEQPSYLSACRGGEAELRLVMNLVNEQQVSLKLTCGLAFKIFMGYFFFFISLASRNALHSFRMFYLCGLICKRGVVRLTVTL